MTDTEQPDSFDAHDLWRRLAAFINANRNSRSVEHRWLACYASDLLRRAWDVHAGNFDTISPLVNDFRLSEIRDERQKLQQRDRELEEEARKLTVKK